MEMCYKFPLLIPQNKQKTHYSGFIQIQKHCFQLDIKLGSGGQLRDATIECEWKLRQLLQGYTDLLKQRLRQSKRLEDFLEELKRLLEIQLKEEVPQISPAPKFYGKLVEEIEAVGWERLVFIDSNFRELHLQIEDAKHRQHVLKLVLHSEHPSQIPKFTVDLPRALDFRWTTTTILAELLAQFTRSLDQYQDLWDCLDEVDQKTWVLEPEKPNRSDCYRRIALGNNASVQVTVNVQQPRMLPECCFMGADHVVNPLKAKFHSNLHTWDPTLSLLGNLCAVLQVEFPSPAKTSKEDFSVECGICYSYRLGEELPDQACDDARCGQPFHHSCLYEWLRALPSFRQSFNVAFGECPYCSTPITMKITKQ